jgi:hypothetical protein
MDSEIHNHEQRLPLIMPHMKFMRRPLPSDIVPRIDFGDDPSVRRMWQVPVDEPTTCHSSASISFKDTSATPSASSAHGRCDCPEPFTSFESVTSQSSSASAAHSRPTLPSTYEHAPPAIGTPGSERSELREEPSKKPRPSAGVSTKIPKPIGSNRVVSTELKERGVRPLQIEKFRVSVPLKWLHYSRWRYTGVIEKDCHS